MSTTNPYELKVSDLPKMVIEVLDQTKPISAQNTKLYLNDQLVAFAKDMTFKLTNGVEPATITLTLFADLEIKYA